MLPVQALLPQVTAQVLASRQSMVPMQPEAGQVTEQGIPIGHLMLPLQGLQAEPQLN
jgi:hypothetical protein